MKFEMISAEEYEKFTIKSPYRSFMQTLEIAKYRQKNGWVPYYFGVLEDDEIIAASLVLAKPTFLGKSTYIAPGGPQLDFENRPLAKYFLTNLAKFAKSHNGYVLEISPYYELIERDRNGEPVEGGFNHTKTLKTLELIGFKSLPNPSQPKYLFALDIDNKTPDELFMDFKRNTRNHIRKAEKMGVTIREIDKSELKKFKAITESTSERRNFTDRPLEYYEEMYDLFATKDEAKFILAEAKIDGKTVPLSAAMFMLYGDEIVYLFSGSDKEYMRDYNAQYLIQWYMIKYAAEHKFKRYNFYGIQGLPDPNAKDQGIYEFKKGFGGHVIELIGSFELSLGGVYHLHNIATRIKSIFK